MPELPEVETIRRGLAKAVVGQRIVSVFVAMPKLLREPVSDADSFQSGLSNRTIENVRRRGKYLIFELDNGYALLTHLKMRGSFRYESHDAPQQPYMGVRFSLGNERDLRYHDMWGWGEFRLISNSPDEVSRWSPALARMGNEPFDERFEAEALRKAALRRVRSSIKAALLDQSVVAGVGNIYSDEALFRAGIRPDRRVGELSKDDWCRLREAIVSVLTEATEGGGTESDNFFNTEGMPGTYVPAVYGRHGKPCLNCSSPLVRIKITGRGTVYCPNCQP